MRGPACQVAIKAECDGNPRTISLVRSFPNVVGLRRCQPGVEGVERTISMKHVAGKDAVSTDVGNSPGCGDPLPRSIAIFPTQQTGERMLSGLSRCYSLVRL